MSNCWCLIGPSKGLSCEEHSDLPRFLPRSFQCKYVHAIAELFDRWISLWLWWNVQVEQVCLWKLVGYRKGLVHPKLANRHSCYRCWWYPCPSHLVQLLERSIEMLLWRSQQTRPLYGGNAKRSTPTLDQLGTISRSKWPASAWCGGPYGTTTRISAIHVFTPRTRDFSIW